MDNVRKIALSVLTKCEAADGYSNLALDSAIKRADLTPADRGLLTTLVYGTLEKRLTLDAAIAHLCARPLGDLSPDVHNLLRMGLYQMAFLDRVPDHAAVNETVNMAPRRAKGFVNAILRAFAREGKRIPIPDRMEDPEGYLSVKYSFGRKLCARFLIEFGLERTESLFAAFGEPAPLTLRVNTLRISRDELLAKWEAHGIAAEKTTESPVGIRLLDKTPPLSLPGFDAGECFVQDEASQLCVEALDARPEMRVLDTCACPGSKSFGAAINMQNRGTVLSCDLHRSKLSLVEDGARRLGLSILAVSERDAREDIEAWHKSFDRVLCDVPCSGFGVFAKKPELRYKDPAVSAPLPAIQRAILETSSAFVKYGGLLVYSTCTILPAENEDNINAFLQTHADFSLQSMRTYYPDTDRTDGFFCAVLQRHDA